MTLAPLIGLLLVAAPAQPQIKLASPGLAYVKVGQEEGEFFLDFFAKQIELRGVRVTTNREIAALVGFERQRQLLNCGDGGSSCLAELAGALGVDGLITGSLAKVGSGYVINLKVVDNEARTLAVFSERLKNDDALLDWLSSAAEKLVVQLKQILKRDTVAAAPPKQEPPKVEPPKVEPPKTEAPRAEAPKAEPPKVEPQRLTPREPSPSEPVAAVTGSAGDRGPVPAWVPAAAGGGLLVGGVVSFLVAQDMERQLQAGSFLGKDPTREPLSIGDARAFAAQGRALEVLGYSLMGVGVAGLGLSGYLMFAPPPAAPRVSVMPTAQGATLTVGGSF